MSERNNHDSLGLPEDKESFRFDGLRTFLGETASTALDRALDISSSMSRTFVDKTQDLKSETVERAQDVQATAKGIGVSAVEATRDKFNGLQERFKELSARFNDTATSIPILGDKLKNK